MQIKKYKFIKIQQSKERIIYQKVQANNYNLKLVKVQKQQLQNLKIMILNSPKTSTSLSEIETQFDLLMSNDTGYKSLDLVDCRNDSNRQKRNPQTLQIKDKVGISISPIEQSTTQQSNEETGKKQPETSQFQVQNDREKQSLHSNKFRKSVDNALFLDNFQSMFKKKTTSFQGQENIEPPKKIKSLKRFHQVKKSVCWQLGQQAIQKTSQQQNSSITFQQKILQKSILLQKLKNIHIFYKMNIDQQVNRRKKNDSIFIQMLHENEKIHLNRVQSLQNLIASQRQQVRMNEKQKEIKNIQVKAEFHTKQKQKQLLRNIQLKQQLDNQSKRMREKQQYLTNVLQQEKSLRQQVENNQKTQLRLKKWRKQVDAFMTKGHQQIQTLKRFYDKQDEYVDWKRSF